MRAAHVVADDAGDAAGRDLASVLSQVALETAAGQQAGVLAIVGDQHLCAGLGVGGTGGTNDGGQHQGAIRGARAVEKGQEAVKAHR